MSPTPPSPPGPALVVVAGPIASGKSTLAARVASGLREAGHAVVLVGLDEVAEMALPTLPSWDVAHEVHAELVAAWLRTAVAAGIEWVVAEGPGTPEELRVLRGHVPAETPVTTVLLTATFPTALARAQADPTRGLSKNPEFLAGQYARFESVRDDIDADLRIDTEVLDVGAAARLVLRALGAGG